MPPIYTEKTIRTGIHDFKTNISKYIRILDEGDYEQVILTSRGKPIGGFATYQGARVRAERAKMSELSDLLKGSDASLAGLLSGAIGAIGKG